MSGGAALLLAALLAAGALGAWLGSRPAAAASPAASAAPALPEGALGWRAEGPAAAYDAATIFSYLDGHAEVYLAYGMRRCTTRRYAGPGGEGAIRLDVFEMESPADAFGVCSLDRDGAAAGVGHDSRLRYGWLSFWRGRHFVSVTAEAETEASRQAVLALGRAVAAALPGEGDAPAIVAALPRHGLETRSVRYLRDAQTLKAQRFVAAGDVFGLGRSTPAALGRYARGPARADLLVVDYPDEASARRALVRFEAHFAAGREAGVHRATVEGRRLAAVLGAGTEELARDLLAEALEPEGAGGGGGR